MSESNLLETTKRYYDSTDADEFYHTIWGGEDIHVGLYQSEDDSIFDASQRTVLRMVEQLPPITAGTYILDLGSGYGGAARFLAGEFGCKVDCLNLSQTENDRNIEKNKAAGLDQLITVITGNFEEVPFPDNMYDIVWSEDAFLHSGNKEAIFKEANRVLKPGGHLIFHDPMQADDCPENVLEPILNRIHLKEMGSVRTYKEMADANGFREEAIHEMPEQLVNHYSSVLAQMNKRQDDLAKVCSQEYIENMKKGLRHWIEGGKNGYLNWGILHFVKSR